MNGCSVVDTNRRGSALIWLAYTLFFFIDPILQPSVVLWTETLIAVAVFLPMYLTHVYCKTDHTRRMSVLGIFIVGLASFPWNTGASTFFIYVAALLPFNFASVPLVLTLLGVESLAVYAEAWIFHMHMLNSTFTTLMVFVIGGGNILFAQQKRSDSKLRMAHEEIEALAAVAERERIARDLHDVLGHTLSLIVLKAELAGRLLDAHTEAARERARAELADVEGTARTALAEVREAIGGYRSKGLAAEIEAARRTLQAAGVTLHTDAVSGELLGLSAQEETVLALAMREAVTNIVRHARASTCRLRFAQVDGYRRLVVEDAGQNTTLQEGNGLRGMRERVEALGGNVQLDRSQGTRLSIELPLAASGAAS